VLARASVARTHSMKSGDSAAGTAAMTSRCKLRTRPLGRGLACVFPNESHPSAQRPI
jgi:hypothetical protein